MTVSTQAKTKKKKETSNSTVAIEDDDLLALLGSLPIDIDKEEKIIYG